MVVSELCLPNKQEINFASAEIIDPLKRVINAANFLLEQAGHEDDLHRKMVNVINEETGRIYQVTDRDTTHHREENRYGIYDGEEFDHLASGLLIRGIQLERDEKDLFKPKESLVCIQIARDPSVITLENCHRLRNLTVKSLQILAEDLERGQIVGWEVYFEFKPELNRIEQLRQTM
jgi:hypothetical protein